MPTRTLTRAQIIQAIKDELEYDPNLAAYHASLGRRVQRAYEEIISAAPWKFAQKTSTLQVLAPVSGSSTQRLTSISTNGRRIQATNPFTFSEDWEGHVFVEPDGTENIIGNVDTSTSPDELHLLNPVNAAIDPSNYEDWSIRFDRYQLPADCAEVLGFMDRRATDGEGRLDFVTRRQEERHFLDRDDKGHPYFVVEDDDVLARPPNTTPTLTLQSSGGLTLGVTYEYCYTMAYQGRESPPSPVASIVTTSGNLTVRIANLEEVRWNDAGVQESTNKKRRLYRRDATNNGRWMLVKTIDDSLTLFDDTVVLPAYAADYDHVTYLNEHYRRQTIRLWHTPNTDRVISLRYRYLVPPLVADTDTPILPPPYGNLLVYRVLADLLAGGEATKFERRYNTLFEQLSSSHHIEKNEARHFQKSWMEEILDSRPSYRNRRLGVPSRT